VGQAELIVVDELSYKLRLRRAYGSSLQFKRCGEDGF